MSTSGGTSLPAAHRVINWIHGHATHPGAATFPAIATGFAHPGILMRTISNGADGGTATGINHADFPTGHLQSGAISIHHNESSAHAS